MLVKLFEDLRAKFRVFTDADNAFDAAVDVLGFDSSFVISMILCTPPDPSATSAAATAHAQAEPTLTTPA